MLAPHVGTLKGAASAFIGGAITISPQFRIVDANDQPLMAVTGTGGVTFGLGGSYEGEISFDGGMFKFSSKGKLSAGLGVSWGASAEVNLMPIYHLIFG